MVSPFLLNILHTGRQWHKECSFWKTNFCTVTSIADHTGTRTVDQNCARIGQIVYNKLQKSTSEHRLFTVTHANNRITVQSSTSLWCQTFLFNMLPKKSSLQLTQHTTSSRVYIPQGFTITSHNWHILGIHLTEPFAFSATWRTSTTVHVRLQRYISQDKDNHNLIKHSTLFSQPCVLTTYKLYKYHLEFPS